MIMNSKIGRSSHSCWNDNYSRLKDLSTGKTYALCLICDKKLWNTSQSRLSMHKRLCLQSSEKKRMHADVDMSSSDCTEDQDSNSNPHTLDIKKDESYQVATSIESDKETDFSTGIGSGSSSASSSSKVLNKFADRMTKQEAEHATMLLSNFFSVAMYHFPSLNLYISKNLSISLGPLSSRHPANHCQLYA